MARALCTAEDTEAMLEPALVSCEACTTVVAKETTGTTVVAEIAVVCCGASPTALWTSGVVLEGLWITIVGTWESTD